MSPDKHSMWIVVTDSNTCRIYTYCKKSLELTRLKEIQHPENKLKDSDLTSSKPGHYKTNTSARGAYSQPSDPKEIKIDAFSREIAKELDHGRKINAYKKLIIVAAPHMHGLLFQHIDQQVKDLVYQVIGKDLLHMTDYELFNFLQIHR